MITIKLLTDIPHLVSGLNLGNLNQINKKMIMETNTTFTDKVIDRLRKAAAELEELQVQLSLGKAEARDKFEELKKNFSKTIQQIATELKNAGTEKAVELKSLFDELQVQLSLGRAEAKEVFNEQRKKIENILHQIELKIKGEPTNREVIDKLFDDIRKFRITLEIIAIAYELGKYEFGDAYKAHKRDFEQKLDTIKKKVETKTDEIEKRAETFKNEITEAYNHLKKAFLN